jgi:ABC-type polysaccharide/polyol phosphate transport system ATPase subunit
MPDIEFRHVSKRYTGPRHRPAEKQTSPVWKRWLTGHGPKPEFWALRDVSFNVEEGESLGIIGHNGAGKSTILKMLSHVTTPTEGEIVINRNLSALVEVSAGFHPELTGRENVYLNGVILGMSRQEVSRKLPSIMEFSGIGEFIDMPVKRYSSGMYVRLGFAIAAHLDPDILLLDEVLAVGDVTFQWKCLDRIDTLRKSGRTIVLVSHDLAAIERLCDRAILLSQGQVLRDDTPRLVIEEYQRSTLLTSNPPDHVTTVPGTIECTDFYYDSESQGRNRSVRTGDSMIVRVGYVAHETIESAAFNVYLYWPSGYLCTQLSTGENGITVARGRGHVEFRCPFVNLRPGLYMVDISAERSPEILDWRHRCAVLRVDLGPTVVLGDLHMRHESFLFEGDQIRRLGEAGYRESPSTIDPTKERLVLG